MSVATLLALALATAPVAPVARSTAGVESSGAQVGPRVVVAPIELVGEFPSGAREQLSTHLQSGLVRSRVARLTDADAPLQCQTLQCLLDRARDQGATHLVRAEISVVDKIYDVRITAYDSRASEIHIDVQETCEVCGLAEVAELVERQAATLGDRLADWAPTPGVLSVESQPRGAAIALDGDAAGYAPLRLELEPGPHRLRATLPGHAPTERRVVAKEGVHETWSFTMQPLPRYPEDGRRNVRRAGWAVLGIGTAAFVPGVVLLAVDGRGYRLRCGGSDRDAEGDCRYRNDTLVYGAVLTACGAALLATGIGLLVASRRRR
jgi:hypothetical protein